MATSRRVRLSGAGLLAALVGLALVAQALLPVVPSAAAQGMARLRVGLLNSTSDAGFYIAQDQGYFREAGIELDISPFDSAANMVAPLGTGQLDIGGGSHSAGLYNAIARGVNIRLVADKGSAPPGFGFQGLVIRRDLMESGEVRGPADLRGRRVSVPAQGITPEAALARWLQPAGLSIDDVNIVLLNFAEHPTALAQRGIDASVTIEPFLTRALDIGAGSLYQRTDQLVPNYQIAEVLYGGDFMRAQPDVARRFMVAYVRALRFYNDALVKGDAAKRQQVVESLTRHTPVKDAALYDRMALPGLDPDGRMSVSSLAEDQELWLARGIQQQRISMDSLVDTTWIDAAVQTLGPY